MITSGSYRKRYRTDGSQYWQITIELPKDPITGKRVRKYKSVEGTKKDAEREMHSFVRELERKEHLIDSSVTIAEWMDTWIETFERPHISVTTISRYEGMIKRYIKPMIGHVQLQKLNPLVVQDFVNGLKISPSSGKPMAAATIKHTFQLLRTAFEKAVLVGLIDRNPCIGVMLPKGQKKAAVIYDEEQIKQLIAAAKGTEMELVIDMELCLGLRRGELLGLWWQDIDWEKKQIHIVRNRVVVDGKSVLKNPKTEKSVRVIDMPDQLVQKLKLHQWTCMATKKKLGKMYKGEDYIIVHPSDGKPIYPEYLSQMLTKLQKKANLPQCRFHDLRHLCATLMILQGINIKVVQAHLGHSNIATTMDVYAHVLPSAARDAAEKLGSLVFASA